MDKDNLNEYDTGGSGGNRGGEIVAQGTPEQVAKVKGSYTGDYLGPLLDEAERVDMSRPDGMAAYYEENEVNEIKKVRKTVATKKKAVAAKKQ